VAEAKKSTTPETIVRSNQYQTNLLTSTTRRQSSRSALLKQFFKDATRRLNKTLKQEEELAQRRYVEKLSPISTKHPLWRDHPNDISPMEVVTRIKN